MSALHDVVGKSRERSAAIMWGPSTAYIHTSILVGPVSALQQLIKPSLARSLVHATIFLQPSKTPCSICSGIYYTCNAKKKISQKQAQQQRN